MKKDEKYSSTEEAADSAYGEDAPQKSSGGLSEGIKAEIISWGKTVLFAVIFALCINNLVIVNATVPTGSMQKNIMPDDRIVAFRLSYLFGDPQRFDVVVLRYPDDESTLFVKRIIGMPGETVEIRDGSVYIDGSDEPLPDNFVKEKPYGDFGPYKVPEGQYFMLGDNRNSSKDSRYWNNTYVSKEKILGKVVFRYYPGFRLYNKL